MAPPSSKTASKTAAEQALVDFFTMCNMLYKFLIKPTVAILCKGETLKRLLDQRWTVSVILRSFDDLATPLREIKSSPAYGADVRVEAAGLLQAMSEPSFRFDAEMVHKILLYRDPPNMMLQKAWIC